MKYHEVVTKINRVFSGATRQQDIVAMKYCHRLIKKLLPFGHEHISQTTRNVAIANERSVLWRYVENKAAELVKK